MQIPTAISAAFAAKILPAAPVYIALAALALAVAIMLPFTAVPVMAAVALVGAVVVAAPPLLLFAL